MGSGNQKFSTIIVTSKDHSETKSYTIKTKYLKYWRAPYLFGVSVLMCVLFATVSGLLFYIQAQDTRAKNLELQVVQLYKPLSEVQKQPIPVPKVNDTVRIQPYIDRIQAKLKRVNEYLNKRGVRGFSNVSIGGNNRRSRFAPNERLELYNEYLTRLLGSLKLTPLGYPHHGGVSSVFGYRSDPFESNNGEFHAGMDFHGLMGEKVRSTASGKVIWASRFQGYGNCVRIAHANGYQTLYGHLSEINVKDGQPVQAGDVIGLIGSTGHSTGPHLHYEVRLNNKPINPNKFLSL
jgi:murein DD-endopeptidase MepM/ murein hydrolase activator NlpD